MSNILIVEDETGIRELIADILEYEGYEVTTASNGLEALNYLRTTHRLPKLILLDLNMPVMTGFEFCDYQQKDPTLMAIPVLVMSAGNNLRKWLGLGKGYIEKPIDYDLLLQSVERYLLVNQE